ncbi:protein PRRC2C isoform X5 [Homalodisca vitripennis]|uniref:protein PRRC2C isoform X5 n=1 Tax=Homalodisca vitripennis TaxID=197043 RepID=UPI001EEB21AF|nr:protein PRRC2C isoform X5 [Homalodisca vitripennis]
MSTLSGITAKGEKGKSKFQSLDINNLYRASRGESLETHQHKNTSSRRHGMQSLGKVPSARRAPANLPSLKSEYSGNDPAVSLVPSGGTGWGSKPGETGPPPPTTQVSTTVTTTPVVTSVTSAPVPASVPVSTTPTTSTTAAVPIIVSTQSQGDKSWSSITSSGTENTPMFLAHQSPYFQQEFPSLSGDASAMSGSGPNKSDPAHLPGPSLRPQTEGSWMQGGSRPQGQMTAGGGNPPGTVPVPGPLPLPQGLDMGGGRSSLAPPGVGGVPAGPQNHYRLMPQFMIRHNQPPGGFPPNYHPGPPRPRFPPSPDLRLMPPNKGVTNIEQEEITSRPIIKEEDLKVMDEISRDTGWAAHDEIDYNQTLSFSDEEGVQDDESKAKSYRHSLQMMEKRDVDNKMCSEKERSILEPEEKVNKGVRQGEDEEDWREKRRVQNEQIAIAVERAKQRREEEEKRYNEISQAAARKLHKLEEMIRSKNDKDETSVSSPLTTQHGSNTLLPDWEKDKERNRSRTTSENKDEKSAKDHVDNYRNIQGDNRSSGFGRDRERDRDLRPDRDAAAGQHFSRQFQNNLPPRFQKQAADRPSSYYRQNSGGSPQPPPSGHPTYDMRWPIGQVGPHFGGSSGGMKTHRNCNEREITEYEREETKAERVVLDNAMDRDRANHPPSRERNHESSWKGPGYHEESSHNRIISEKEFDNRQFKKCQTSEDYIKEKDTEYRFCEEVRDLDKKPTENKSVNLIQDDPFDEREEKCDNKIEVDRRDKFDSRDRPERPQRPDSRDSRASRDSRNSRDSVREDNKFVEESSLSWADATYDVEQKEDMCRKDIKHESDSRRDLHVMQSYHQRHIPGPITKEKLEASELRCESNRNVNLVPLVRTDKKPEVKKIENQWEVEDTSGDAWQRVTASPAPSTKTNNDCWADVSRTIPLSSEPSPDAGQEDPVESQTLKTDTIEHNKTVTKTLNQEPEELDTNHRPEFQREKMGRGGNRGMRHDSRGQRPGWGGSFYRGGAVLWRGEGRGRRTQHRRPNGSHEWGHSESEASADEVSASTESGKEDKRQDQEHKQFPRSPKQGVKKSDKDERMRDNRKIENDKDNHSVGNDLRRYEKRGTYGMGSGFEPRGEPSRRGRGAPFRSKGSATNVGRRMDGYGPPTSKRPFTSESTTSIHDDKKPEDSSQNPATIKEDTLNKMSHDERMKMNQQQLSAGIIGNTSRQGNFKCQPQIPPRLRRKSEGERRERKPRDPSGRGPRGSLKSGSGSGGEIGDENWETTSEASEQEEKEHEDDRNNEASRRNFNQNRGNSRRQSQPNRSIGREKQRGGSYDRENDNNPRRSMVNGGIRSQNKSQTVPKEQMEVKTAEQCDKKQPRTDKDKRNNLDRIDLCNTASVVVVDDQPEVTVEEDQTIFATDSNGFQEVRSKKNVKEANRQQKEEPQKGSKDRAKPSKPQSSLSPGPSVGSHLSSAPINKGSYEQRPRTGKLPPRFAKLRENTRLQKIAQQQHDVNDLNKINQGGASVFPTKDLPSPAPPPPVNAWDKPITAALRTNTPPTVPSSVSNSISVLVDSSNVEVNDQVQSGTSSQRSSPNDEKTGGKLSREQSEKAVLDGTSPPVQTIIFENTNYKSAPMDVAMKPKYTNQLNKSQRPEKAKVSDRKLEEDTVAVSFKAPGPEMKLQETKSEAIQMPISFNKNEDNADMKLDFRFDSDLSQLADDKSSKNIAIQMTRSIQMAAQSELQFKLASVKKVWENSPAVLEHGEENSTVSTANTFTPTFGNSVEPGVDSTISDDGNTLNPEGVYNAGQQLQNNPSAYNGNTVQNMIKPDPSSNVCKLLAPQVKPQPQATMHPHPGPLSPPSGAFTSSPAQPSQHINYQSPAQYGGIPAIPSPPTVFTPQAELYPTFQLNNPQVIGNQGRSQFSQFASPYLSQGLGQTSGFSQQSMYLHQTAPPPPSAAPPDIFQTQLSQYRIQPPAYGTSQQLSNNPNTVLISSSTNSLMSASVKPSPQSIGAIGSKASFQTPSQPPPSQLYIYPDPQMLNQSPYQLNSPLVQRPASNVVPTIPPSSSYYSASTGGGATGFYQPGGSSIQAAAAAQSMHQSTFGMQAFNTQSPAATPAGMGSFGSTFLSNGLQMAQQYRSTAPSYLKSAADHQDALSVFSSPGGLSTQINPPKPRGSSSGCGSGGKPGSSNGSSQQQPSPTQSHHKFSAYQQNVSPTTQFVIQQQQQQQQRGSVNVRVAPCYPAPIQRPVSGQCQWTVSRHRLPTRYKMPPHTTAVTATATATHFYIQNNSTKVDNTELVDVVNSESENNSSITATTENTTEDPTSAND